MKPYFFISTLAAVVLAAPTGHAIMIGYSQSPDRLLGTVAPGTPADEANEVRMINFLLTGTSNGTGLLVGYNNGSTTGDLGDNPEDSQAEQNLLQFSATTIIPKPAPIAALAGFISGAPTAGVSSTSFSLGTSFDWLLAKYANFTEVYYIGDLAAGTVFELPNTTSQANPTQSNGRGLSGWSVYNPGHKVPDGGTTLALLGLTLLGAGVVRSLVVRHA